MNGNDKIIFAIGLASVGLLAYSIFPNIGMTYDSHLYLSLADNLNKHGFNQMSFGSKPPLFPIVLWLIGGNLFMLSILNIICWVISLLLTYHLFIRKIEDGFYKMCLSTLLFLAAPMFMVHSFAWTEPIFILLVLAFLYFQEHPHPSSLRDWILKALLLLSLVALKHLGIALISSFALVSLLKERSFKKLTVYFPASLFFIFWQVHSFNLRGDLSRLDHLSGLDLQQNLTWVGETIVHWVHPFYLPAIFSIITSIAVLIYFILELRKADFPDTHFQIIPLAIMLIVITKSDLLNADMERYFSLVYPFLFYSVIKKITHWKWSTQIWLKLPVVILIAYSVTRTIKNVWMWHGLE